MDFDDDVVETSDVEELEELRTRVAGSPKGMVHLFSTRVVPEGLSPPRKKMKFAHEPDIEDRKSSPSPARSILTNSNTPHRSQSSSLTVLTTSPGRPQFSSSRTQTPDIIYNTPSRKLGKDALVTAQFTPAQAHSQDPLLLVSATRPQLSAISVSPEQGEFNSYSPLEYPSSPVEQNTTPTSSPPGPRRRSELVDRVSSLFTSSPLRALPTHSAIGPSRQDRGGYDELLAFSPAKPTSLHVTSSPLSSISSKSGSQIYSREVTPEARRSLSPSQASDQSIMPEPGPSRSQSPVDLNREAQSDTDAALAHALNEQPQESHRYTLRDRRPAQINPFTAEALLYEHNLKDNPEAVVKFKPMDRRRRHPDDRYEEEEETQQDGYTYEGDGDQDEDRDWEELERRRQQRREEHLKRQEMARNLEAQNALSEREPIQYPGILQDDLSSTDEEKRRQMNVMSKEGRKLLRQEKKKRRAEEKERRRREEESRKAKRFPVLKSTSALPKPSSSKRPHSPSPERSNQGKDDHVVFVSRTSPEVSQTRRYLDERPPEQSFLSDQPDLIPDYFAEDEVFQAHIHDEPMEDPMPSQHSPLPSSFRNSYEAVINVDSDQDEEMSSEPELQQERSHSQSSTTNIGGIEIDLPAKKTKFLERMMPKVMIASLAKKEAEAAAAAKKKKRRVHQESRLGDVHSGPLLPGQTRVQIAAKPKDVREIKGDSESELEVPEDSDSSSSPHDDAVPSHPGRKDDSESDEDDILKVYRLPNPKKLQKSEVLNYDDFDDFDSDSDGGVQITTSKKGAMGRLRDPSAVDYMLARARTIGGSRKGSVRPSTDTSHGASSSRYKIDVVTSGAKGYGRGRQAQLSFDNHRQDKKQVGRSKSDNSTKALTKQTDSRLDDDHLHSGDAHVVHENKRKSRKEIKKIRRKAEKARGVWTMRSNGDRITTGRDTAWVTVDLQDEEFCRALEPSLSSEPAQNGCRSKGLSSSRLATEINATHRPSNMASVEISIEDMREPINIPSDFRLSPLHSGMGFGVSTYIRKGLLHELLKVACSSQDPSLPNYTTTSFGFELGPATSREEISSMIPSIFDALFEFATGLPDPDSDLLTSQWSTVTRIVCQLVSWHLKNAQEQEAAALRNMIGKEVTRLVAQVQESSLDFIEAPILTICWYFVELSTRSGSFPAVGYSSGPFKDSVHLLMQLLLQFGLKKTLTPLQQETETETLDGSLPAHLAAELWVRLIHVLNRCTNTTQDPMKYKIHPFWLALIDVLPSRVQACKTKSMKNFEISNDIWRTIFSICNLSQFSVHGMTVKDSCLPACWDVVAFALKEINLKHSPEYHDQLRQAALLKRDNCVALAAIRCFHLRDKWQWRFDDASVMFNQLAEVFRSRKFCNLLHEDADYPKFFRDVDWDLLSSYDPKDSAFAIFLKLVYQAVLEDPLYGKEKLPPRVRKLLSMTIPMGSLPFSKTNPPNKQDLTMLYNRMAALAVITELDRSDCDDRISKARSYISFVDADDNSRMAVIRALTNWAQLLVSRGIGIKAMGGWIEEIATVIGAELRAFETSGPAASSAERPLSTAGKRLKKFTNALLGAVRQVVQSYTQIARYPEPFFILSLRPVISTWIFKNMGVKREISLLVNAIFDARGAALPAPSRPLPLTPNVEEDSQESQDFELDLINMDWSSIDLPALQAPSHTNAVSEPANCTSRDSELREAFLVTQLNWRIYDFAKEAINPPKLVGDALKAYTSECDTWLRLLLCYGCLEAQMNTWNNYLGLLDKILANYTDEPNADERWVRRVRTSIMFQILKLHPLSYLTLTDRAFEVFLYALVSDNIIDENGQPNKHGTLEREYAAIMLSIGGHQHPLLSNAACLPDRSQESGNYGFSPEEFLELRVPLLRVVFANLNQAIRKQHEGNFDAATANDKYIDMCWAMFSGMRYCLSKLDKASEKILKVNDFCHQVVNALKQNADLCNHPRLKFWVRDWPNNLMPPRAL